MPADLPAIRAAAADGRGLLFSAHYLRERLGSSDRPWPSEIRFGLVDDWPRIVREDPDDVRGPLCEVACTSADGQLMTVRINYGRSPLRIVTAFYA